MAIQRALNATPDALPETLVQRLLRRWRRATPALLLTAVLAVSLVGMYAVGRSVRDLIARPSASGPAAGEDIATLSRDLTRAGWSQPTVPADVVLVTPGYFQAVGWTAKAGMNPRDHLIFLVAENVHDGNLTGFVQPELRIDGGVVGGQGRTEVMADSPHHRTTALIYARPAALKNANAGTEIALTFPGGNGRDASVLSWDGAVLQQTVATTGFHLTGASALALLAGMVASMWPCLFQLTAYFIPSLAGVSMAEARGAVTVGKRLRVVKMATFFVLGIVIVYTLAGAAAGLAAQSFGTRSLLETWRRPLTFVAGGVMLVMALRLAARARLPLVCKMPLISRIGKKGQPGYGSAMVMGLAYATGCATCFGAAVLVGTLVYVGVAGAPLTGAAVMFLFSVGMGIPLIIGAGLMAQVLPLLERLESGARYLTLASSGIMLAMAVLLLSDRFMVFSNEAMRLVGQAP